MYSLLVEKIQLFFSYFIHFLFLIGLSGFLFIVKNSGDLTELAIQGAKLINKEMAAGFSR